MSQDLVLYLYQRFGIQLGAVPAVPAGPTANRSMSYSNGTDVRCEIQQLTWRTATLVITGARWIRDSSMK